MFTLTEQDHIRNKTNLDELIDLTRISPVMQKSLVKGLLESEVSALDKYVLLRLMFDDTNIPLLAKLARWNLSDRL